jgi:hypothetical protein
MGYIIPAIGERNMSFEANAFLGKSTFTRPDLQKWLKKACTGTSVYVSVVEKSVPRDFQCSIVYLFLFLHQQIYKID